MGSDPFSTFSPIDAKMLEGKMGSDPFSTFSPIDAKMLEALEKVEKGSDPIFP